MRTSSTFPRRFRLKVAGGLRAGLSVDEAADVIWATNSSELYVLLTIERGWPADRYERWLAETWCRLLLPDTPSKSPAIAGTGDDAPAT